MKSDRVLVTGATGVVGTALQEMLAKSGYDDVIAVGSADADLTDIDQTDALFASARPDLVFHLAARVYGLLGNLANKANVFLENTRINTNVVDAACRNGASKIVAMGSAAIYSDDVPLPMKESNIWMGEPHDSEAAYAHSKRGMLAQLVAYRQQYGLDFAYCVSTNLYGPNDRFDENWGHVLPSLISKFHRGATTGAAVSVWGTGSDRRDFLYTDDAAEAMLLIAERYTGAINLATGESHTICDAVKMLTAISGLPGEVTWDTTKPDGQHLRDYDVSKLRQLGFEPKYDLEAGLRRTYEWFDANQRAVRR
jgi:GDP-L-fucose synthase